MKKTKKLVSLLLIIALMATLAIGCTKEEPVIEDVPEVEDAPIVEESPEVEEDLNITTDVVVIGSGGAGLTAALEAKSAGKDVIIVEKMSIVGGNSLRATGGLNAGGTPQQEALGIEDSAEIHYEDTMKGGYEKNDPELVKTLTTDAPKAVEWLISIGADLSDVGKLGGSTNNRSHRPTGGAPVGPHIVEVLKENIEKENIEILLKTEATEILYEDNMVKGITAKDNEGNIITIEAKAVIIATGGFSANSEMVTELNSELAGFGTTNHPGATGDGIVMATKIGAATTQMEEIQTHPTVVPTNGYMITEAVRGNGAIIVNRDGKRFTNEMGTRDVVSEAILEQEKETAYLFFDDSVRESLSAIDGYIKMGLTTEGESIEEIAAALEINAENLKVTIDSYNTYVDAQEDTEFARPDLPRKLEKAKYYAIEIGPAIHHTMGGLKINSNAEVLNTSGDAINGLFAAGEVTGGVHGGNRLGGNAVADIIVFGRIAGKTAAEYIK
ncbi:MAG TPA: flavocytochrome c [Sedimentibacter sp.]|nr:flavocytochrome c [Sedimentibacter sp.]